MNNFEELLRGDTRWKEEEQELLVYGARLPRSSSDISKNDPRHWVMKYYEGSISREEHNRYKKHWEENTSRKPEEESPIPKVIEIYDAVFSVMDSGLSFWQTDTELDTEALLDLYLGEIKTSSYREALTKLCFIQYCTRKDRRLRGIAFGAYDDPGCSWAREAVSRKPEYSPLFLSRLSGDENYNKAYGIRDKDQTAVKKKKNIIVINKDVLNKKPWRKKPYET